MGRGAILSGLLHVAVILLTVIGLPWLYDDREILTATSVTTISEEQFAELQSKTPPAQKKQDQPKDETIPDAPPSPAVAEPVPEPDPIAEEQPPPAPEPAPPAPAPEPPPAPEPQPSPAPAPEPQPQADVAPEPQEQVVAPPVPEPQPEQPVVPTEQQVAEAQPKPVPPKKPKKKEKEETTKKEDKPKETQVAQKNDSFLPDLAKKLKEKGQKGEKQKKPPSGGGKQEQDNADPGIPQRLPFGEEDAIRRQIEPNWNYNPGLPGIETMTVDLILTMNPDGSVQNVEFADQAAVNASADYRAFAESAKRAVNLSSPLKMPANRPYELWKRIVMGFRVANL